MMTFEDAAVERAAKAGYEKMVQSYGMSVNKHPWDKEHEDVRRDWRAATVAILEEYGRLRTEDDDAEIPSR